LKKIVILSTLIFGSILTQQSMADTELKGSCLRENPLAVGETDPALINIYSQACDRKNKDNVNSYLVLAAERFQQLGKNWKALQLVHSLQAKNIQSNKLTDVKFMASAAMAQTTINQMRSNEARYLDEDTTYVVAKDLINTINFAKPSSVLIQDNKAAAKSTPKAKVSTAKKSSSSAKKTQAAKQPQAKPKATAKKSNAGTPFDSLKK
jgi:hypothetical protein